MKKNSLLLVGLIPLTLLFQSYGDDSKYGGGSPGGYTGSPGDAKTCVICHGGTASNVSGWITSDIPAGGYVPGTTYTITVTITGSGKKGFEVSPQTPSGALVGTLTAGSGTHLVNGNKAVTQSSSSTANPYSKTFSWTAPAAGTGDVTFYGAFTLNKPVTKLSTYVVSESTTSITELQDAGFVVYPNPVNDQFFLKTTSDLSGDLQFSLVDLSGKRVSIDGKSGNPADQLYQFQRPARINPGVYFLEIKSSQGLHYSRVILK